MNIYTPAYHPEFLARITREGDFIFGWVSVPAAGLRAPTALF
jgi:hypothetical protein